MKKELKIGDKVQIKDAQFFGNFDEMPNAIINCNGVDVCEEMINYCGTKTIIIDIVLYHGMTLYKLDIQADGYLWSADMLEVEDESIDVLKKCLDLQWTKQMTQSRDTQAFHHPFIVRYESDGKSYQQLMDVCLNTAKISNDMYIIIKTSHQFEIYEPVKLDDPEIYNLIKQCIEKFVGNRHVQQIFPVVPNFYDDYLNFK